MAGVILLDEKMCNKKQDEILEDAFRLVKFYFSHFEVLIQKLF